MRALLAVMSGLGAGSILLDELLRRGLSHADERLLRAEHVDPGRRRALGARVAGVEAAPPPRLGVVLGFSTAREGLVPELLEAKTGLRWLNLAGSGGSFFELAYEVGPLLRSRLALERVVLAVHPVWLAGRVDARRRLDGASALLARRAPLRQTLDSLLFAERERLVLATGSGLGELYPPAPEPYRVERLYQGRAAPAHLAAQLEAWTAFRWFDPARYLEAGSALEADSLVEVVRALTARGSPPLVLLMPESQALRERVPGEAIAAFVSALGRAGHPPVLDLRAAIPEEHFHDYAHVAEQGRALLSERLAAELSPP